MAAMTLVLTDFSRKENSVTYRLPNHTAALPEQLVQRRREPKGNQVVMEDSFTIFHTTVDSEGLVMPQKCAITATVKRPVGHLAADMTNVLADFRDVVASDEFTALVTNQDLLA